MRRLRGRSVCHTGLEPRTSRLNARPQGTHPPQRSSAPRQVCYSHVWSANPNPNPNLNPNPSPNQVAVIFGAFGSYFLFDFHITASFNVGMVFVAT